MENWVNYITITALIAALFGLILADRRRTIAIAFGAIVLFLFSINVQFWTFGFALSKLLTGIMSILILVLTHEQTKGEISYPKVTGKVFNSVGLAFCIILVLFTINNTSKYLAISHDQVIPSLSILLCGFILLGISQDPFRIVIGLLTVLIGFEVVYGAVEQSLLINGLLTAVELLVAFVGSFLLTPVASGEER